MKKFLAVVLATVMVLSMMSFASAEGLAGEYEIKVWVADAIADLTQSQIDRFNETNEDGIKIKATIEKVGEGDAASNMVQDVEAGADIYCFAQDQLSRLLTASALAKLGTKAAEFVTANYDADSVASVTVDGTMYAYPLTADNGYFMYYDKSVIPEEHVASLEKLIEDCEKAGKFFSFDLKNVWYSAGFFFGTGCVSSWVMDSEGNAKGVVDDFNSDKGLIALKGMKKLLDSDAWNSSSEVSAFESNSAIVVSGTWGSATAKQILGDNLGVAELPSYEVDGASYHVGSFFGFKLMGIKPQEDPVKNAVLNRLAQYLTGKECSLERFASNGWGPANLEAQADEAVKSDPILAAVYAQKNYGQVQSAISGAWWNIGNVIAEEAKDAADEEGLKQVLANYEGKINESLKLDANALLFVGAWNGWNNADENDTYYLKDGSVTLDVPQSDYMGGRIVKPADWGNDKGFLQVTEGKELIQDLGDDVGDNNIVFLEPGNYTVTWDGEAITIVKN
ncbi:MAG: extracellular solute-binding protein [Clostridia bacterium]|nr:extracellular solute-binding protein [Clostridia bacterium]